MIFLYVADHVQLLAVNMTHYKKTQEVFHDR